MVSFKFLGITYLLVAGVLAAPRPDTSDNFDLQAVTEAITTLETMIDFDSEDNDVDSTGVESRSEIQRRCLGGSQLRCQQATSSGCTVQCSHGRLSSSLRCLHQCFADSARNCADACA
ncbi:hypothetical protein BDV25DRAFT_135347 [Aspergillus avenaceus]|uniref:Uncharacterized protein n=1 Tax=Aspergillus avenaceus TaxID=36643 RepID=A0A5N6U8U3_ASPAV|nr:hypothetical protein BDV25DRAFT_135347 [Aspergillus avenaceus]